MPLAAITHDAKINILVDPSKPATKTYGVVIYTPVKLTEEIALVPYIYIASSKKQTIVL